jgi:hypothetical protein
MAAFRATRQNIRGIDRQVIMAVFAHQVSQPHHFATVVNPVVVEILEHFAPFQLGFIGNIRQLLPQALFITRINTLSVSSSWLSS